MNAVIVLVGAHVLFYQYWTLDLYMSGTLLEVFGIVLVITKFLFPKK